ncbi:MAG: Uma2 family endonuclease [Myxococcota bacterium]
MVQEVGPKKWSRDDYGRLIDAGVLAEADRVQLISGEIVQMSPEKSTHAVVVELVAHALRASLPEGWHIRVQHPLALSGDSEPEPDVAVVAGSIRDYLAEHPRAAALVVEVSESSLAYDRGAKAALYARSAVETYWLIDLTQGSLEVRGDGALETLGRGEHVTPPIKGSKPIAVSELLP